MAYPKLVDLTLKLNEQTTWGNLDWQETGDQGAYQVSFADYTVWLSTAPSKEGARADIVYKITIFNEAGSEIESFDDEEIREGWPGTEDPPYQVMGQLYSSARRIAAGTEKAIDAIISLLDDMPPF